MTTLITRQQLPNLSRTILSADRTAVDTETWGYGKRFKGNVRVISVACLTGRKLESFVIDVNQHDLNDLSAVFYGGSFDGWNANFDAHVLDTLFGKDMAIDWYDGMIADAVLYQGMSGFSFYHSLAWASDTYCGTTMTGKGTTQKSFTAQDPLTDEQIRYAAEDAELTVKVCQELRRRLGKLGLDFVVDLELKARPFLDHMERCGMPLDWAGWQSVLDAKDLKIREKTNVLIAEATGFGQETLFGSVEPLMNPASTKDVKRELNRLYPDAVKAYTMSVYGSERLLGDADAIDATALKQIDCPLSTAILAFKGDKKVLSTYGANLKKHLWEDGRMRPSYMQVCGTGTGRLSSRNPNAQNLTPLLKPYFKAQGDNVFVYADLSQAELRFLAELSGDSYMTEAFIEGRDIHEATAERMFNIDMVSLSAEDPKRYKELRARGKAQPLDEPILTPTGWSTMGSIKVGDFVVGSDGYPTAVTGVFPQGKLDNYELKFDDGSSTRCSIDHLWSCHRSSDADRVTVTLKTILEEGLEAELSSGVRVPRWHFPFAAPWKGDVFVFLPADPYTLGTLLDNYHSDGIPDSYLRAGVTQRADLLSGLMATNGYLINSTEAYYCTSHLKLAEGVTELVRSLGGSAVVTEFPEYSGDGPPLIRIKINLPADINPFLRNWVAEGVTSRRLVSVTKLPYAAEMQCISVEAEDHLYVTKDFVLTHNTLNFGIVYGLGAKALATTITMAAKADAKKEGATAEELAAIEVSVDEAKGLIEAYRAGYPLVAEWLDERQQQVKKAIAERPIVDWKSSIELYDTLREIGGGARRFQKAKGFKPTGVQLARFLDQYGDKQQMNKKGARYEWALQFEAPCVLVDRDVPYALYSYTESGRRRQFNITMDQIYTSCIQLMLRSDRDSTVKRIVSVAAEYNAVLHPTMSNDEIAEVFKGRGKGAPDKQRIIHACGEGRSAAVLENLFERAFADRIGSFTNAFKNHPVQGGVGDAVLLGYHYIWSALQEQGLAGVVKPVQTVHDSVTLECPKEIAPQVRDILKDSLERGLSKFTPTVPARADAAILTSLDEADSWESEVDEFSEL